MHNTISLNKRVWHLPVETRGRLYLFVLCNIIYIYIIAIHNYNYMSTNGITTLIIVYKL